MKVEATFNCLQGITKISRKETDKIESFKGRKNKKEKKNTRWRGGGAGRGEWEWE
jgi:hypothetical protein